MGTTLTGTTPQDTYDSLIKVTDNGPLTGSLKTLTDGLGNNSALALSTAAASVTGTLAVSSNATLTSNGISLRLGSATMNAGANLLIAGASSYKNWSIGVQQNIAGCLEFTPTATNGATTLGTTPAMVILDNGNVGIGTSAPTAKLHISKVDTNNTYPSTASINVCNFDGGNFGRTMGVNFSVGSGLDAEIISGVYGVYTNYSTSVGGSLSFVTNNGSSAFTEKARITSDGYLRLATGGIQFNGDTAAANALDDYEEGTWTMGVSFGGLSVGVTTSQNTGTYTKIGRQVTVNGLLVLTNKGSSTGAAKIKGLPFTVANTTGNLAAAAARFDSITFANQFQIHAEDNTTTMALEEITEAGAVTTLSNSDFANSCSVLLGCTYFV